MTNKKDLFQNKSKNWDMSSMRVRNAKEIASVILANTNLKPSSLIIDFGAGTGLLSYFIAPYVGKIIAIDNSPSMLDEFIAKKDEFVCETEALLLDLTTNSLDTKADAIISSMTLHHVQDIKAILAKFYSMLNIGGYIGIADLDSEDGTFHSDDEGVFHLGFDRDELKDIASEVGFVDIKFETANEIKKPNASYTVFAMTARKES
jgi:ubiquinone/menaquinone biosynthesis C-methylase UbiE